MLLVLATSSTASAATLYWNTTTTALWSGTSNWSTAVSSGGTYALAPTSADLLNFNQYNVQGSTTVQLDGSAAAMGIWFNNERSTTIEASAVGTQTLTLFTGGTAGNFSNQLNFFPGTGPVTIGHATRKVAITLGGAGVWNNASSSTVTVLNDLNLNGLALVFASSGNPGYAPLGNSVFAGSITGTGTGSKLTVAGGSVVTLSGSNSFAGGTTIDNAARLNINNAYALGSGTLTIGNTLTNKQFDNTSGAPITLATNNPISWNSGGSQLGGVFVGSNNLNLGTGAVTWVQSSSVHVLNNTLTIGGAIVSGSTNFNLEKWGTGKLVLSGSSGSYSGTAWINDGTLQIDGYFSGGVASSVFNGLSKYVILSGTGRIGGGVNLNASTYSAIDLANGSVDSLRIDGAFIMGGGNYAHFDLGSGAAGA
ncbi:MAG: autotransporter-associated beta strand repeat-containing protein, partial [Planctomycetota bacterium]